MNCPVCSHEETRVVDSRLAGDGFAIRRRRECEKCEYRFSTSEEVELLDLRVVKSDGRRMPYERGKIEIGLRKALEKRPYLQADFQALLGRIERDLQRRRQEEVTSREIGETVMGHLKDFDIVAYIRFASVYQSFTDIDDFNAVLKKLGKRG
jgi:transcriptional repressor NrdR